MQITGGPHQSCDVLTDVCDGSCYKEHQVFSNHPTALQIIAYYNDISITNLLGSSKNEYKLGRYTTCILILIKYME